MQVLGKGKENDVLKGTAVISAKELAKPAALLRPAQKPLANITSKNNASNGVKAVISAVAKKPLAVRSDSDQNIHHAPVDADKAGKAVASVVLKPLAPRSDSDLNIHHAPVVNPEPAGKALATKRIRACKSLQLPSKRPLVSDVPIVETKVHATVVETKVQTREEQIASNDAVVAISEAAVEVSEKYEYLDALEEQARVLEEERNEELAKVQALSRLEQEECWDEEEDEEYFDADGYTTARSLRSRGDNTTGGVTLVLAPRITSKSQRELKEASQFVAMTKSEDDIEDEQWDTSMVAEYGEEIFEYMHSLEERMKPNASYMDHQAEIQWSMRSVLMDWIVQVHNRFTLLPETLFLAVNYVDRFLSCKVVSLGKLQLVGATALFVAAKYEEINCPSVQEIVYMVDGAYTVDEILKAERFMLSMLQFELGWPGPMSFLRRISKADDYDLETRTLAKYFLEITVMDERFVGCAPSFLAAGAHCLARLMLKKGDWSLAHVHYSGYTLGQQRQLVSTILECCDNPRKHHAAVFEKYVDKRLKRASLFVETEIAKGFQLPFATRESLSMTWKRK